MKRPGISLGVIVGLALPTGTDAQTPRDTAEARQAVRSFYEVLNSHRLERAVAYTADDWETIRPDGRRIRGRDAVLKDLATPYATFLKDVTLTIDELDIRFAAATAAIVTVTAHASTFTSPDGVKHENEQRVRTFVVAKRNGRWLILQDQSTTVTRR